MGDIADYYREHQLVDMALSDAEEREFSKRPYWYSSGTKLWVDEMDLLHINNTLSYLERNGHGSGKEAEAMKVELEKRISK